MYVKFRGKFDFNCFLVHKEVEEESSQRLQELNNLLKTARERHSNTLELKDGEISKLKETNQVRKFFYSLLFILN